MFFKDVSLTKMTLTSLWFIKSFYIKVKILWELQLLKERKRQKENVGTNHWELHKEKRSYSTFWPTAQGRSKM